MKTEVSNIDGLLCEGCNLLLEAGKVHIRYMKSKFPAELLVCPGCGLIYVPEELAIGKMAEVERTLEDK
ncbi:MAG: hypothetical protein JEZ04_08380 [Spirochaetales bacterium]|nr:hypothetical protein [Spirochaetales bacterium]